MRAQLSLLFTDNELYYNLIEPYKQNKELRNLIMRCLTAYYYNEEVRRLVEGAEETSSNNKSAEDCIANIRDTLFLQGILTDELNMTVEDGKDDVVNRVNNFAQDKGVYKKEDSEFSDSVYRVNKEHSSTSESTQESEKKASDLNVEKTVLDLMEQFSLLKMTVAELAMVVASKTETDVQPNENEETSILNTDYQSDNKQVDEDEVLEDLVFENEIVSENEHFDLVDAEDEEIGDEDDSQKKLEVGNRLAGLLTSGGVW